SDGEEIPKTNFEEVPDKHISDDSSIRHGDVQSEDPFGFTPKDVSFESVVRPDILSEENRYSNDKEDGGVVGIQGQEMMGDSNDNNESTCSGHFKKSKVPSSGGSIIQLIDDLVNVGQTMGYDMTGCINNMEKIIGSQGVKVVHR
ncbi:hypothetical protein Tco_0192102, partial [Tanacetum coccineum]